MITIARVFIPKVCGCYVTFLWPNPPQRRALMWFETKNNLELLKIPFRFDTRLLLCYFQVQSTLYSNLSRAFSKIYDKNIWAISCWNGENISQIHEIIICFSTNKTLTLFFFLSSKFNWFKLVCQKKKNFKLSNASIYIQKNPFVQHVEFPCWMKILIGNLSEYSFIPRHVLKMKSQFWFVTCKIKYICYKY